MNLHIEKLPNSYTTTSSRRCPTCTGPVAVVASHKHKRVRCTVCGTDVGADVSAKRSPAGIRNVIGWDVASEVTRNASLRPSLARAIVRNRAALIRTQ